MYDISILTPAQREFMTLVGQQRFGFFDMGIVEDSDAWGDDLAYEFAALTGRSRHEAAGVMAGLSKTSLWSIGQYQNGNDQSWALTSDGAEVANRLAAEASK